MAPDLDHLMEMMEDYSYDEEGEELGCEHVTIIEFANKYRSYPSTLGNPGEVGDPHVRLLHLPDQLQKLPAASKADHTSVLLTAPAEIQVAIFKCLPYYFRPQLARSCKTLAKVAQANDLLICNAVAINLLADAGIPLAKGVAHATPQQFPIFSKGICSAMCAWCRWSGELFTVYWFRHLHAESSRLGLHLTVGMVKPLAYEAIWHRVTDPENGCRDMGEVLVDSSFMQWTEDMDDELLSPIRYQLRDVRKNVRSVSDTTQPAARPDDDSDEEDYMWWANVEPSMSGLD